MSKPKKTQSKAPAQAMDQYDLAELYYNDDDLEPVRPGPVRRTLIRKRPPSKNKTVPSRTGAIEDRTEENLYWFYKQRLKRVEKETHQEMAELQKELGKGSISEEEKQAIIQRYLAAYRTWLTAYHAGEEAKVMEASSDTYVVHYNNQISGKGEFHTMPKPGEKASDIKLYLSINPNKGGFQDHMETLTHEILHAYEYETGQAAISYGTAPDPTLDVFDEVRSYQREQDLLGVYPGADITPEWVEKKRGSRNERERLPTEPKELNTETKVKGLTLKKAARLALKAKAKAGKPLAEESGADGAMLYKGWQKDWARYQKRYGGK